MSKNKGLVPRKDNPLELSEVEYFLFLTLMRDAIGKELDTGNASNMRGTIDKAYRDLWKKTGGKTYDMRLRGESVATYSVTTSHEKHKTVYDLDDIGAFTEWLSTSDGIESMSNYVLENGEKFAQWVIETTGEIPDGVNPRDVKVSCEGDYLRGSVRGFKPQAVIRALGGDLQTAVAGLLNA